MTWWLRRVFISRAERKDTPTPTTQVGTGWDRDMPLSVLREACGFVTALPEKAFGHAWMKPQCFLVSPELSERLVLPRFYLPWK